MFRYFVHDQIGSTFILTHQDAHHVIDVVKLKINEQIECVYQQTVFLTKITTLDIRAKQVVVEVVKQLPQAPLYAHKTLIMGVLREQKWDYVLQKATELGVDVIVPVIFQRNVVKISAAKQDNKLVRWQAICVTAAKQAKRTTVPIITPIITRLQDLQQYCAEVNLVAWEEEHHHTLKALLPTHFASISVVIGCEGGISSTEIALLNNLGFQNVSLGYNILRAETAPLYVLSSLIFCEN